MDPLKLQLSVTSLRGTALFENKALIILIEYGHQLVVKHKDVSQLKVFEWVW